MISSSKCVFLLVGLMAVDSFQPSSCTRSLGRSSTTGKSTATSGMALLNNVASDDAVVDEEKVQKKRKRDKIMAFLRNKGAVGRNQDFSTAMGVDEGPVGKNKSAVRKMEKTAAAYKWCTDTGIIDDCSEPFPKTPSGSEWTGFTDQVMGGVSIGKLERQTIDGRECNVMLGKVSLYNNGGFIQMAQELTTNSAVSMTVDASAYDGIELDVYYRGEEEAEKFNVHLRTPACIRKFSSFRNTFEVKPDQWQTVRLPFDEFVGHGPGVVDTQINTAELKRIGIVAIGKAMEVNLGVSKVALYKNE